ncbi:amino-acid racemase [Pullulanibacillus camelliae]|uniref:Amino-acid racemase n=1 Tax=Pullulanibacillus camelliae TaxID=1707096 RepID=A0A8J2YNK4_9BACL|nr:YhfX family PLP-dependent enzyme [Pullulanibacillus camelliae]GGE55385.1 amino-acid racemase [Pullulanibacillus camelliae]
MFLHTTQARNPELLETAGYFHRKGLISPNTYVIDYDAVQKNARKIAVEASRQGVECYFMTKQIGRNPLLAHGIMEAGLQKAVAVDPWEARVLGKHGIPIGHVGHLVQIPQHMMKEMLSLSPEVVTVFSYENAKVVSQAAMSLGYSQDILLRVVDRSDFLYPGQKGGIFLDALEEEIQKIAALPGVHIKGATNFPCLLVKQGKVEPTQNFKTLQQAGRILKERGFHDLQINTPSATSTTTLPLIKEMGGTQGEPGHALTGTTPLHAQTEQPEIPAMVYVSEISHLFDGYAHVFGGGFYPRSHVHHALVGRPGHWKEVDVIANEPGSIDYYGTLATDEASVGDTVLYAFRTQIFVTNAQVAVVSGIGHHPQLLGLFDSQGQKLI